MIVPRPVPAPPPAGGAARPVGTSRPVAPAAWRAPLRLGALAAGAVAFTSIADPNRPSAIPLCPFKLITGWDCPFCGSMRATHALTHAHLGAALDHNVLFVLALPFVLVAWSTWLMSSLGWPVRRWSPGTHTWWALGATAAAFMLVRNLPVPSLQWLASG